MRLKLPPRLELPPTFPAAKDLRELPAIAQQQQSWWQDVRGTLQNAIESLRGARNTFDKSLPAGTTAVSLGTAPADGATPYVWVEVISPDGTPCVMPLWKKG